MDTQEALARARSWENSTGVRPAPQTALAVTALLLEHIDNLTRVATGEVKHLYKGNCPDPVEGTATRDPDCPACRILAGTLTPPGPSPLSITKEGVEVKVGQVWQDLDKRMGGRQCRVVEVCGGKAKMQSVHSASVPATTVSIHRMHKGSTGWSLVSDAQ